LQDKAKDSPTMGESIQEYKEKIIDELQKYCHRIIKIIDEQILPSKCQIKSVESKVFYLKLKGDYFRYLCEWSSTNTDRYTARACYEEADNLARSNLPQTNPVRLSLHLNMSVFLYEQENEMEKALQLANRAFEEAIANIDTVNEENYKDCTMILQLIRDNISLWDDSEQ
jgi:14-3-3 protein epsilon